MEEIKRKTILLDSVRHKENQIKFFDFPLARFVLRHKKKTVLLARGGFRESFFTRDSKLYYTPEELKTLQSGSRVTRITRRLDALSSRDFAKSRIYAVGQEDVYFSRIQAKYQSVSEYSADWLRGKVEGVSMTRMWNVSIVSAVIFGMVMMTMIYRYLGQNVSAQIASNSQAVVAQQTEMLSTQQPVAGDEIDAQTITNLLKEYNSQDENDWAKQQQLEKDIRELVKGYPIESMVSEIAKQDRVVAAFVVAIAKKESGWGTHVPVYQGQDCYNLWGWRGKNAVGSGGHTCFASPEEAVQTVSKRIAFLVSNKKLDTPQKMIVWKCGDCGWDNAAAMKSWISDVDMYFRKLNKV